MAEVQPRSSASRGRGSTRGRGGFSGRGGRSSTHSRQTNGSQVVAEPSLDDQGELGQLKKHYWSQLSTVKEVFPDWTDDDIVFALQETDGDVQSVIERISEGHVFQFTDVKKKPREKSRVKSSNDVAAGEAESKTAPSTRGGRGRGGSEAGRGGRGRGSERGRGGARGGRGGASASLNGARVPAAAAAPAPVTTEVIGGWDTAPATTGGWDSTPTPAAGGWDDPTKPQESSAGGHNGSTVTVEATSGITQDGQRSSLIPEGSKKSWASMLAKPKQAPVVPKPAPPSSKPIDVSAPEPAVAAAQAAAAAHTDPLPARDEASEAGFTATTANVPGLDLPKDPLTEENVEHLPDNSGPPPTETVASTRGEPHSAVPSVKPSLSVSQQAPIGRPSFGSLHKAATQSNRSLSFQRLKEQQDAVVMPGNHALDRAAVQFGQMGLGNDPGKPLDVDDEREDAETRAQPPQQSPSAPRASLPPAARAQQALTGHEQAPGMGMPSHQHQHGAPGLTQTGPDAQGFDQYGRYGAGGAFGHAQGAPPQKEYDPFSSQLSAAGQNDARGQYPGSSQAPGGLSQPATAYAGYNQGPSGYDSQYSGEHGRGQYSNYYGGYGQQTATSAAENQPPQRSTSGFGDQYGAAQASQTQSRFAEGQASGNNTPNPPMGSQSHQSHQMHGHGQSGFGGHYGGQSPYGYYSYGGHYPGQGYGNQYSYGQGAFGSYGKGGMYGGQSHHGYGMSSQGSFEQSSSPANTAGFGGSSAPGRDAGMSSNLNEYSRSGSTQPTAQSQTPSAAGGFGNTSDSYGRSSSGFGSHNQGYGAPTSGAADEPLKSLHDPKTGPSPALGSSARPGSGFNTSAPGYGPPQGGFGGAGSYQGQLHNQYGSGSGYGGSGGGGSGLGGQHAGSQGHQGGGYGGYQGFSGNSNYGGRGGWGNQYNNSTYTH